MDLPGSKMDRQEKTETSRPWQADAYDNKRMTSVGYADSSKEDDRDSDNDNRNRRRRWMMMTMDSDHDRR